LDIEIFENAPYYRPGSSRGTVLCGGAAYPRLMLRTKRIYDEPSEDDGLRVLVDRLWPRGLSKEKATIDRWEKDIAPTNELRKWFGHDPEKWEEFLQRYRAELEGKEEVLARLRQEAGEGTVTLLYAAKDEEQNNAVALKRYIEEG
jgi:uncharacterized protein YeaO (DUF488 family)